MVIQYYIELTRENGDFNGHLNKFKKDGVYYPLISQIENTWIILNFTCEIWF